MSLWYFVSSVFIYDKIISILFVAEIEPLLMIKEEPELKMSVKSEHVQRGVAGTSSKKLIKPS
jgi:hypothetical protein